MDNKYNSNATASIGEQRMTPLRRVAPVQKAKDFKGTIKMLWKYMEGLRMALLLVVLIILASATLTVLIPGFIGKAVDAMGQGVGMANFPALIKILIILGIAYITNVTLIFLQQFVIAGVSQRFVNRLRTELFAKLQKLPLHFFDTFESGDIMSRLTNDMDTISGSVGQSAVQFISGVLTVMGALIMMFFLSPILAGVVLLTTPFIFLLTKAVTKRTGKLFSEQQFVLGMVNSQMEESIGGIQTVRAFGREKSMTAEFDGLNDRLREVGTKAQIWSGIMMPVINVINNLGFTMISAVGGVLCLNSALTIGVIASFVNLQKQFTRPLNEIATNFNLFLSAIAGAERVFEIMNQAEEAPDPEGAVALTKPAGRLEFRNVEFGYTEEWPVLRNINFEVAPTLRAAFVGPTGAGKTTIINLLTRFYDVTKGQILLDGVDLRDYTRDSIRSTFGVVLQETYLFGSTVRENIRYGRLNATDEEVEQAAKVAGADGFIVRLENGYETILQDNGENLSSGQRQMIAIARAVLADPPILILDEATSNVDTRTELRIQRAMAQLMKNRTTFVIAHRLGTIRDADIIMVVAGGEIIERGTHAELMKKQGFYYKMYTSQMGL